MHFYSKQHLLSKKIINLLKLYYNCIYLRVTCNPKNRHTLKNMKTFDKTFWIIFGAFAGLILIILTFPFLFTNYSWFDIDFSETGEVGDTIGGIMGPFIAIAAAILTFFAFWVQYIANETQKKALIKQERDLAQERFETKFYKQIEILKSNIDELQIGETTKGRKAFISLFSELKFIYHIVNNHYQSQFYPTFKIDISEEARYNISYLIFFFGIGENSTQLVRSFLTENLLMLFENAVTDIQRNQTLWREERAKGNPIAVNTENLPFTFNIKYLPGNGHTSKLSHYVRHLFQTVKFVHEADENVITPEMKYNYLTVLRSQLSPHEQLFIYYNALSIIGKPWIEPFNYIKKYCLIKSSLIPIADFYVRPVDKFGTVNEDGRPLFEWTEISKRLQDL